METNSTSHGIITRATQFYEWTLTLSGKTSFFFNLIRNFCFKARFLLKTLPQKISFRKIRNFGSRIDFQ